MLRIGSLFSGYGGLDLAVASVLGASVAWHVEFDKHPSAILAHHFPGVPNYGDVSAVDWSAVEPVDILTGGFPCQDLSTAGKRAGLRPGTRSGLWEHMAYAINELRPELVVIENVRGLLSAAAHSNVEPCPMCVGDDPGDALRALGAVLGDLADLGYDAQWCGVRAADAGAPHGRFRVFIVAHPSGGQLPRAAAAGHGLSVPAERGDGPVALFSTPTSSDRFGAGRPPGRDGGDDLRTQISLLPTPTAQDERDGTHLRNITKDAAQRGSKRGIGLNHLVEGALDDGTPLLPTPRATNNDNQQNLDRYGLNLGMALMPAHYDWTDAPQLLPTPTTQAAKHAGGDTDRGNSDDANLWMVAQRLLPTPRATDGTKGGPNQRGSSGDLMLPSAAVQLLPTPSVADGTGGHATRSGDRSDELLLPGVAKAMHTDFGPYAAAVARWEAVLGRPAPAPTEPGTNGKPRLSPRFVEWMMGLPDGWVTDGIPRNAQLKALGNGVVPQQAALALRLMLGGAS